MHRIKEVFKTWWPLVILIIIELVLFFTNYKPNTFLIGWDNLYPELNPILNIKRSLFGVWQYYRGVGYMDGMSHAANLFHDIFRFFLSLIVSLHLVRWLTIFLLHLVGGLGMYLFLHQIILRGEKRIILQLLSLFGALFYQYNLFTIQQFFLPFELFLFHFAFLPWLLLSVKLFLDTGSKKDLILFAFVSFLSVPQAHVPTIFIVYLIALCVLLFVHASIHMKTSWKRILLIVIVTFGINAYWGIPFTYSTLQNASTIANSKNNQMGTDDIFYRNLKFGDLNDVVLLKGVVVDYFQYNIKTQSSDFMMRPWYNHIDTIFYKSSMWILFIIAFIGCISAFLRRNRKKLIPFVMLFFVAFAFIANDAPIISFFTYAMRTYIPLFHNIFRFSFTKFSILYVFCLTIMIVSGMQFIAKYLSKISIVLMVFFIGIMISNALPAFTGNFFYQNLAASIPPAYFSMFDFFKKHSIEERVAILPIPSYWAWTQNYWDTIGSGFTWYGIPQPTMDRAFDPWSDKNENFYWELEQAVYSKNPSLLEHVFQKYDIHWIVLDSSIYRGSAPKFDISEYKDLLKSIPSVQLTQTFNPLEIYSYSAQKYVSNLISIKTNMPQVQPSFSYDNNDQAFQQYGNYFSNSQNNDVNVYYPFRSLFTGKKPFESGKSVELSDTTISFTSSIEFSGDKPMQIQLPNTFTEEFALYDRNNLDVVRFPTVTLQLNGKEVIKTSSVSALSNLTIPLIARKNDFKITMESPFLEHHGSKDINFAAAINNGCEKDKLKTNLITEKNSIEFNSVGSNNCVNFDFYDLYQRYGYLFSLKTKNSPIKGLYFNIINAGTKKSDLDIYLNHDGKEAQYYIFLPPRDYFGMGYTVNFNNISFGREKVSNKLEDLRVYQIPYRFLKEIRTTDGQRYSNSTYSTKYTMVNYFTYLVEPKIINNNQYLYLSQGFDKDWRAYFVNNSGFLNTSFPFLFGREIKEHVLINNWANGWELSPGNHNIVIVFWPQYLEFIGFGLLILTFFGIFLL